MCPMVEKRWQEVGKGCGRPFQAGKYSRTHLE